MGSFSSIFKVCLNSLGALFQTNQTDRDILAYQAETVSLVSIILTVVLAGLIAFLLTKTTVGPLRKISDQAEKVADEDITSQILSIARLGSGCCSGY